MATHEQNGRSFLAEEVQAQRKDITELVKAVSGLQAIVREMVADGREERQSAKEYRHDIREQLYAQRAEQQQVSMSLTGVVGSVETIKKTLGEHETERQQTKGGLKLATASARMAWALVGAGLIAAVAWFAKFFHGIP